MFILVYQTLEQVWTIRNVDFALIKFGATCLLTKTERNYNVYVLHHNLG